jgi:lysophospholipase L1-like esterase
MAFMGADLNSYQYGAFLDHWNKYLIAIGKNKAPMCIIGNSTIAARSNAYQTCSSVADLMNDSVVGKYYAITDLSTAGETTAQQKARWLALSTEVKRSMEYVFIDIGFNDFIWVGNTTAQVIASIQDLVTTVSSDIGPNHKIVISTFTPVRTLLEFRTDLWTPAQVTTKYNTWVAVNEAIMDGEATPITRTGGVLYRVNNHTLIMSDDNGYFEPEYDCGDHGHPTCAGKQLIADEWEQVYFTYK